MINKKDIKKIIEEKKRKGEVIKLKDLREEIKRRPIEPTVIYILDWGAL